MASSTTHVIEIESGIGEPAFIPLTLGQELQPISVGKRGMWRIESARVLDVHAFVYFDGTSLFLQSADEESAASVDGYRVGKAWTELHAPCQIEIGSARLRFRALAGEAEHQAATMAMQGAPVQGMPGLPAPPPRREPDTLPKAERPFKPGEFAARPDDDSTRVAPLESTGAQRVQIGGSGPLPAAGRPIEEDDEPRTRAGVVPRAAGSGRSLAPPGPTGPFPAVGMQPVQSLGAMPMPSYPPAMGSQPQMMMGPQGPAPMAPGSMPVMGTGPYPQQAGYPMQGGSGQFSPAQMGGMPMGSMPPGQMGPGGMPMGSMPPGQMGPGGMPMVMGMGALPAQQKPGSPMEEYVAKYRELSPPKKILVFIAPLCLIAAFYVLLVDEDPPPVRRPTAAADAGADGSVAVANTAPVVPPIVPPSAPIAAACPPGFEPYPGATPTGGVIPCVPVGAIAATGTDAGAAQGGSTSATDSGTHKDTHKDKDPSPTVPTGQKTLERQAVDYVATGEYAKALAIYEQLRAQHPNNAAYGEAVRILKQKIAGPPQP